MHYGERFLVPSLVLDNVLVAELLEAQGQRRRYANNANRSPRIAVHGLEAGFVFFLGDLLELVGLVFLQRAHDGVDEVQLGELGQFRRHLAVRALLGRVFLVSGRIEGQASLLDFDFGAVLLTDLDLVDAACGQWTDRTNGDTLAALRPIKHFHLIGNLHGFTTTTNRRLGTFDAGRILELCFHGYS